MAYWHCDHSEAKEMMHYVLYKCIALLKKYDGYQTSDGILLRIKITLSIGRTNVHLIGDSNHRIFAITGSCVNDVRIAQSFTKPGTIVIPDCTWKLCDQSRFVSKEARIGFVQVVVVVY